MLDKQSTDILEFIQSNGTTAIKTISDKFTNIPNVQEIVDLLKESQYIKGLTPKVCHLPGFHKIGDVDVQIVYFSPYEITPKGRAYLESLKEQELREAQRAKEKKNISLRENINTVLAALALIVSIIALFFS